LRKHAGKRFLFKGSSHEFSFRMMFGYGRTMGSYTVELMRNGKAVKRADVKAGSDVEAAKTWGTGEGWFRPGADIR
jgi:hypothetical protein